MNKLEDVDEIKSLMDKKFVYTRDTMITLVLFITPMTLVAYNYLDNMNIFKTVLVALVITTLLYLLEKSLLGVYKAKDFMDREYSKRKRGAYDYLSSRVIKYLDTKNSKEIKLISVEYSSDYKNFDLKTVTPYFNIEYEIHGVIKRVQTNNVKIVSINSKEDRLKAVVIPVNFIYGFMQYDLYNITLALTEETVKGVD